MPDVYKETHDERLPKSTVPLPIGAHDLMLEAGKATHRGKLGHTGAVYTLAAALVLNLDEAVRFKLVQRVSNLVNEVKDPTVLFNEILKETKTLVRQHSTCGKNNRARKRRTRR